MTNARNAQEALLGSLSTHNGFSLISNEKLLEIYATMLKCRMLEESIHAISKPVNAHTMSVHIAAIAGAAIDLQPGDTLAPSHGAWAPCFAKGLPIASIFASALGRKGAPRPAFSRFNLIPPSYSAEKQLERALEAAAESRAKRNKSVVTYFSRDAAGASPEFEEAMRLAGKKKLPILFVHETKSDTDELIDLAKSCGLPGIAVEDDDAVAVYRVSTEALAHARRGNGPTLIECRPWRYGEGGSLRRRNAKHPISKMEEYLAAKGLFSRRFKTSVIAEFRRELGIAIKAANR
jgi:TPP-dependent pyruvate/acetoin dehydrogenase alpha subunit